MAPLFGAIPGGPELLVMLVVMLMMLAVPIAFAVGLFLLGRWSATRGRDDTGAKIATLQRRIDELEAELVDEGGEKASTEAGTDDRSDADSDGRFEADN